MQIAEDDLEEFKRIYAAEFGEELSQAEASEVANNLVELYMPDHTQTIRFPCNQK